MFASTLKRPLNETPSGSSSICDSRPFVGWCLHSEPKKAISFVRLLEWCFHQFSAAKAIISSWWKPGSKFQSNSNLQFIIFPSAATARQNPYGFQTLDEGMGVLGSKKSQPCNGRVWYLWWGATIMEAASTTLGRGKGGLPHLGSWIKSFQRPLSRCLFCVHLELSERLSIQASNAESSLHRLPSGVSRHPRGMVCLYGSTQVHIRTACCRCCDWRQGRWDDRAVEATETWQWMFWRGSWMLNILWREVRRHHPPFCRHRRHEILYNMSGISQEVIDGQ